MRHAARDLAHRLQHHLVQRHRLGRVEAGAIGVERAELIGLELVRARDGHEQRVEVALAADERRRRLALPIDDATWIMPMPWRSAACAHS